MKKLWNAALVASALALSPLASADETAATPTPATTAVPTPATTTVPSATQTQESLGEGAANAVVGLAGSGDQVVTLNTGNELVDTVANTAIKCAERSAAQKACDSMGGFKAMGCRKVAEIRYKNVECPVQ